MPEESGGERSLPASQHKKQKAREKGQVAKSHDLSSALSLTAALGILHFGGPFVIDEMKKMMAGYLTHFSGITLDQDMTRAMALDMLVWYGRMASPFLLGLLVTGLIASIGQVGFLFAPGALVPNLNRLNFFAGLGRLFTIRSLVELVKSILKLLLVGVIVYFTMQGRWDQIISACRLQPIAASAMLAGIILLIWFRVSVAVLILALIDYGFQRWQYEQDLRMTVQEAREEAKQLEGDPRIKQRIRQIQRRMAMQRMMKEVPKADVVITNPTTYAVALRYNVQEMDAPVVSAKGARLVAARIRAIAIENRVPIVEKPELARTLYRTVEVSHPVPESLYRAVAEVLKFVFDIDRRAEKIRERQSFMTSARASAV